jgi:hypothetical protein
MPTEYTYPGHESSGASVLRPILYGAILFVLALALFLAASGLIAGSGQDVSPPPSASLIEPALQVDSVADMAAMKARENAWLNSYGWVDKDAGIVRIPIDRAIALTAEQSLSASK